MAPICDEEVQVFHRMDRQVFCCLLLKLARDPTQSLLVMALWLWLENVGYPNIIPQLAALSDSLVNALAIEAVACLRCLEAENPRIPKGGGLPLTTTLVHKHISLHLFNLWRFTAIAGIKSLLNNVCARIFTDILRNVLGRRSCMTRLLIIPGFPHPVFGDLTIQPFAVDLCDDKLWDGKRPSDDVTNEDKTMFLTFSRGFPVSEEEVRQLFRSAFGDSSVEDISMGEAELGNEQPLFATMIVDSVGTVDQILKGKRIAKFRINGKHIWARKYENRE